MVKVLSTVTIISTLSFTTINFAFSNSEKNLTKEQQQNQPQQSKRGSPPPFSKLDQNNNGVISLEEFSQHKIPKGKHSEVFSKIDSNNDGMISEKEYKNHKPPRPNKHH